MFTKEYLGGALLTQAFTFAADTNIAADDDCYSLKVYRIHYDSGGTTYQPVKGDLITAHDNAWYGICLDCTIDSGTWAGGDAVGYLYLMGLYGTVVNDDVWNVVKASDSSAVADEGTTDGVAYPVVWQGNAPNGMPISSGMLAKAARIYVDTQPARVTWDGTPPTPATLANGLTSVGIYVAAAGSLDVIGENAVKNIKICNATAGSNAVIRIVYFY